MNPEDRAILRRIEDFDERRELTKFIVRIALCVALIVALLVGTGFGVFAASAKYRTWSATQQKKVTITNAQAELEAAEFQKKIAVEEALAVKDSAPDLAAAEIIRAEGVAEANRIIADSITDEYVRWLYVDQLDEIDGQIIYIPTEGGLPILEAGRFAPLPQETNG